MKDRFKFRLYDKKEKEMRYEVYATDYDLSQTNNYRFVLMQCTGLKDKNGKLIFEGDIVKLPTQCNKELHGSYSLQEIVWRNGNWILSYISSEKGSKLPRGWTAGFLHNYWSDEFEKEFIFTNADIFCTYNELEVIGNIYENKELLGEQK